MATPTEQVVSILRMLNLRQTLTVKDLLVELKLGDIANHPVIEYLKWEFYTGSYEIFINESFQNTDCGKEFYGALRSNLVKESFMIYIDLDKENGLVSIAVMSGSGTRCYDILEIRDRLIFGFVEDVEDFIPSGLLQFFNHKCHECFKVGILNGCCNTYWCGDHRCKCEFLPQSQSLAQNGSLAHNAC